MESTCNALEYIADTGSICQYALRWHSYFTTNACGTSRALWMLPAVGSQTILKGISRKCNACTTLSPRAPLPFEGKEYPTSGFTIPSPSEHGPASIKGGASPAAPAAPAGGSPSGFTFEGTATSVFTAMSSASEESSSSAVADPSSTPASSRNRGAGSSAGVWRARLVPALMPALILLAEDASGWLGDGDERLLRFRSVSRFGPGDPPRPDPPALLPPALERMLGFLRPMMPPSACRLQNFLARLPLAPWVGTAAHPGRMHLLSLTFTMPSILC